MLKNHKRNSLKLSILAAAIATLPFSAHAAGLGKLTVLSALGQPLRAELEISASREEMSSLIAKVASVDAFRQANIDYVSALAGLRFKLDKHPSGDAYFKISSDRPVNDPFLDFLIELNWSSGRLVREYTFLLDPPEAKTVSSVAPAPSVVAPEIKSEAPTASPVPKVEEQPSAPVAVESKRMNPMTSADAAASKSGSSENATSRAVKNGDTLGKIAAEVKPEGVSLDQMLVALFEINKTAFDGNNVNRLRAGKILTIPDAEAAKAVDPAEAHKIVRAHATDFAAYRRKLAEAATAVAPTQAETPRQEASGKIAPKVEDKTPQPSGKDKLQVSRTETAKSPKTAGGLDEDLVARDKALKDANSRIAELEKNLGDLKKLAELKSQSGADLQKQAQAAKQAPAVDVKPAVAPPAPPADETPAVQASPVAVVPPPASQPVVEAQAPAPSLPQPQPQPQPKSAPPPLPPEEPSFLDENMPYVAGGGGLLVLLAGYFGFKAWKRKRSDVDGSVSGSQAAYSAADISDNSVFSASTGQRVDTGTGVTDGSDSGSSNADSTRAVESVDPLQEAEVYLAYGRDTQAEEILLDALETSPSRLAIHGKLLEIYAARHSAPQFATLAADVHRQTNGSGPEWEHALALGRVLDPTNPLFGGNLAAVVSAPPADEPVAVHSAPVESPAPVAVSEPVPEALDFELDMGSPAVPEPSTVPAEPASVVEEASGLDFDLGMDAPATETNSAGSEAAAFSDSNALDIDFDLLDIGAAPAPALAASPASDENSIDFDLGESSVVTDAAGQADKPLDFDFDIGDGAGTGTSDVDFSSINLDLDEPLPALAESADNPESATKLELAQAYREMGDQEGARGLLQEVVQEGSPAQQELARSKLAALG